MKVTKRFRRICRKYLHLYGEYGNLGLFAEHKIVSEYAENTWKESTLCVRTWRRHKEILDVFS
jgi:hypothetical protein